jgi:aromatic ring-opening dioxygenase LigB subunit
VPVVFAAIAPHGGMLVPEEERHVAPATRAAMEELGRRFDTARPEATIVFTPHNVHVEGAMAVIVAGELESDEPAPLRLPGDTELALACLETMHAQGVPVVGVSFGGNDAVDAVAPLDWGCSIPLWFMGGRSRPPVPIVVVSPARDLPPAEHVRAGRVLADAIGARRVAVIASADHGHAHDPLGPYGFDPASGVYDELVTELVRADDLAGLLELDPQLVEAAKADSFWQMLMLHGALRDQFDGEFLSYECPTYFGLLCAAFSPRRAAAS